MAISSLKPGDIVSLSPFAEKIVQCAIMVSQTKRLHFTFDREKGIIEIDLNTTNGVPENITSFLSSREYPESIGIQLVTLERVARLAYAYGQEYGELLAG